MSSDGVGAYIDYGALAEAKISAAGNSADVAVAGAAVTTVIKSGSNTQHGEFYADFKPGGSKDYTGAENFVRYRDINGQLGGPFIKDRLWYFTSFRDQHTAFTTGMYDKPAAQGGTQGQPFTTETTDYTLKLNYQLSRRSTLTFMRSVVYLTVVLLLLSALLCAQFKVGVLLINVVATVVDGKGRTVPNLTIDDFILEEDGQPQTIKHLLPSADLPISIGVILDASGSMQSKIRTAQRAVDRFLSMIHKDDEIFLMTFAMRASLIADFTSDRTTLTNALLTGVNVSGGTALYDSLYQALQKVKQGRYQKKAVLLVTDGEDTTSLTRFDKALQNIREAEMLVYSIGIKGAPGFDMGTDPLSGNSRSSTPNNTTVDMKVLNRFGEASGGRAWEISEAAFGKNMDAVLDTIAAELRSQYSIGYYPNHPAKDGKWHSVRIRMKNPDYVARARKEYLDK